MKHYTKLERVARIELASSAWKAEVLPLHNTRLNLLYNFYLKCKRCVNKTCKKDKHRYLINI